MHHQGFHCFPESPRDERLSNRSFPSVTIPSVTKTLDSKPAPDKVQDELDWNLMFPFELDSPEVSVASSDDHRPQGLLVVSHLTHSTKRDAECSTSRSKISNQKHLKPESDPHCHNPMQEVAEDRNHDDPQKKFLDDFSNHTSLKPKAQHSYARANADLDSYLEKASHEMLGEVVLTLLNLEKVLNLLLPSPDSKLSGVCTRSASGRSPILTTKGPVNSEWLSRQFQGLSTPPHSQKDDTVNVEVENIVSHSIDPNCHSQSSGSARPLSFVGHKRLTGLRRTKSVESGLNAKSRHSSNISSNSNHIGRGLKAISQKTDLGDSSISSSQYQQSMIHHLSYKTQAELFDEKSGRFETLVRDDDGDDEGHRIQGRVSNICKSGHKMFLSMSEHNICRHSTYHPKKNRSNSAYRKVDNEQKNVNAHAARKRMAITNERQGLSTADGHRSRQIRCRRPRSLSHPTSKHDSALSFPTELVNGTENDSNINCGLTREFGAHRYVATDHKINRNAPITRRPRSKCHHKRVSDKVEKPCSPESSRNRREATEHITGRKMFHDPETLENPLWSLDISERDSIQIHRSRLGRNSGRCSRAAV